MSPAGDDNGLDLTLILGGVRSGKSARALSVAQASSAASGVLFVATAQPFDDEMRQRISVHKGERPHGWQTLEAPLDIAAELEQRLTSDRDEFEVVVIDCLTLWVSNVLLSLGEADDAEAILAARASELIGVLTRNRRLRGISGDMQRRWIIVSNEVGLGVVPPTLLGRRYRDALGRVNQVMAAVAREVTLMVAGIGITVKPT